jgi:shikimate dehydrogenase
VEPDRLADWVRGLRATDQALGCSVTVPHKERVAGLVDQLSGDAHLVGAVNTIVKTGDRASHASDHASPRFEQDRRLVGENTDPIGFERSLAEAGGSLRGQRMLLLGAGGAARSIVLVAMRERAAELIVANRHLERAERLLSDLEVAQSETIARAVALADSALPAIIEQATVIVNATSIGLRSTELPVDPTPIARDTLVVDIVYNPAETAFLAAAAKRGARVVPGLGMLVHQAAAAFEMWTGVSAPVGTMWTAANQALKVTA